MSGGNSRARPARRRPPAGASRPNPLLTESTAADPAEPAADGAPEGPAETAHRQAVCTVALCPICTFVTALDEIRPELAEHLLLAGREILMAVKAVIDARLQGAGTTPAEDGGQAGSSGLEHIIIE